MAGLIWRRRTAFATGNDAFPADLAIGHLAGGFDDMQKYVFPLPPGSK
jgi:hypothetical protein